MRAMPSRSAMPRSTARRSAAPSGVDGRPALASASSSLARARAIGVRRSWAMASDTPRTPSISVSMRSSMVFMVAARRSNSSSRPVSATREDRSPAAMAAAVAKTGRIRDCIARRISQAPRKASDAARPEVERAPSVSSFWRRCRSVSSRPISRRSSGSSTL